MVTGIVLQSRELKLFMERNVNSRGLVKEGYLMIVLRYFSTVLHENVCCGYSLEARLMSTHNLRLMKK